MRNAIVLSDNAPGIPRFFVATDHPVSIGIGTIQLRWFAGQLRGSGNFGSDSVLRLGSDLRAISAAAITVQPGVEPNLTLGLARAVYSPTAHIADVSSHAFDVFARWEAPDTSASAKPPRSDQITSVFGRWLFPATGAEVWAEWARHDFPNSLHDFLVYPGHTRGYTLGTAWTHDLPSDRTLRVAAEMTNLEMDPTFWRGRQTSFYVGRASAAGYTNDGRVVGAAIGPGSSSQWLGLDLFSAHKRIGVFGERIRWNTDAYYTTTPPWPFLGHDVSVRTGGVGATVFRGWTVAAELGYEYRMNYLFQNWAGDWEHASVDAVDVSNWSLSLSVTPILDPKPADTSPLMPTPVPLPPVMAPDGPLVPNYKAPPAVPGAAS
jgi:hypothetical protein